MRPGGWTLLYVGIAEKQTLEERVKGKHLGNSPSNSTVQETLAPLLWGDLDLVPIKSGKSFRFNKEDQAKLLDWIKSNVKLNWMTDNDPERIETAILAQYGRYLPLNIQKNPDNPFRSTLKNLRKQCREAAKEP